MGRINRLSKEISELIAAGEVVERPASAVKELVENSLDAGAGRISVELINGGMSLIRVSDNGEGMDGQDAELAFTRHATSKISSAGDLEAIKTMGFRGEALAAIAAVSRLILLTRRPDDIEGTHLALEAGEITERSPAGCPAGTTIAVKDLFFNTPARMKFLNKNASEAAACEAIVERIALARPDVAFRLIRDGRETLKTPGNGRLSDAIYALLKPEFHKTLIEVGAVSGGIGVSGFVSLPAASRANRRMQYCFVNSRSVRSPAVSAACEQAYKGLMTSGRFPAFVLNISIDPSQVDVNVHPAKTEIKFAGGRSVGEAVYFAGKSALEGGFPQLEGTEAPREPAANSPSYGQAPFIRKEPHITPGLAGSIIKNAAGDNPFFGLTSEFSSSFPMASELPGLFGSNPARSAPETADAAQQTFGHDGKLGERPADIALIGELFGVYILAEQGGRFIIVDKHAAHEKRIYNLLVSSPESLAAQLLMSPEVVRLSREQTNAALEHLEVFSGLGFEIEDFGDGSLVVRSIPAVLAPEDITAALEEACDIISSGKKGGPGFLDRLMFSIACKAAVRAGDKNSPGELMALLEQVLSSDELRNCPHGRPVLADFSRGELEKWFSR